MANHHRHLCLDRLFVIESPVHSATEHASHFVLPNQTDFHLIVVDAVNFNLLPITVSHHSQRTIVALAPSPNRLLIRLVLFKHTHTPVVQSNHIFVAKRSRRHCRYYQCDHSCVVDSDPIDSNQSVLLFLILLLCESYPFLSLASRAFHFIVSTSPQTSNKPISLCAS